MAMVGEGKSLLRVVTPDEVNKKEQAQLGQQEVEQDAEGIDQLAAFIRREWYTFRNWRASERINARLLASLRAFNGEYSAEKLKEIKMFGGSTIYSRVIAVKCRGATSLLRDVYLSGEEPWDVEPTPDPVIADDITENVNMLVSTEAATLARAGQPVTDAMMSDRKSSLMAAAKQAAYKKAKRDAVTSGKKMNDLLVEGGFYNAFAEFLVDLPLFPFAVLKGPVVRVVPDLQWENGKAVIKTRPKMFWERISPFDIYWSPGASDLASAAVMERVRYTRADLNELLGLPGYNEDAIRSVLRDYKSGLNDWLDETDSERADFESREDPNENRSSMIAGMEYHGAVQGQMLLDFGLSEKQIEDPDRDYMVQAWVIGRYTIKVQLSPNPRRRHPYYVTSFEKVPGTITGNGLPDILSDIEEVCNASLRALVNNLSIASGPQVIINDDMATDVNDTDDLYPWKRWHVMSDPSGSGNKPVDFFQPDSNANELLGVYEKFTHIADEISAIPRYVTGSERLGGAGRTASGLAMLMNNASKILQTVAANIDLDVFGPLLTQLYDMVMMTDTEGVLRGDEEIRVRGVSVAVQKETERMRQLEFLQLTTNPVDLGIIGEEGRAVLLRSISDTLGLRGEHVVPSEEQLAAKLAAARSAMATQQAASDASGQPKQIGGEAAPVDNIMNTRDMQPGPPPTGGPSQ